MRFIMRRVDDRIWLNNDLFVLSDLLGVFPSYDKTAHKIHYCDGKKHYVSDGMNQVGCEVPYLLHQEVFKRLPELKMCRSQRIIDTQYFENLRNARRK
jgi:hypothetical protein